MDNIREWATMMCCAAVGSVFTVFLIPDGKLKKFAETVVSLVFLLLTVSLVSDIDLSGIGKEKIDFDFSEDTVNYDLSDFYAENAVSYTEKFITDILEDVCNEKFSVKADIFSDEDNVFVLERITIIIDEKDTLKINEIKTEVRLSTGLVPEVEINQ